MKYPRSMLRLLSPLSLVVGALVGGSVAADDLPGFNLPAIPAETNRSIIASIELDTNQPAVAVDSREPAVPATITSAEPTNAAPPDIAPEAGQMPTPGLVSAPPPTPVDKLKYFQEQLEVARKHRLDKKAALAVETLVALLESNAPKELKRPALFEMALAAQDENQYVKAQQVFAQYLQLYPDDPTIPEVLLRQGLLYRQMGITSMAISKFYAVMSTALKLKLDNIEYYKKLVLQAQVEIADTYYLEGNYERAAEYFSRLLKTEAPELDKAQIQFKQIRSLSALTNHGETVAKAQVFLEVHPNSADVPEVRFALASALKKLERNPESMKQVLLLLQSQQENVAKNPEMWIYWQRRAGNEIANQLYKEGDFLNALQIYLSLAGLDKSPAWQLPVWYQTGLVYEQLQQWQKATDIYQRILDRRKEVSDQDASPGMLSVFDMAQWRKEYLAWMDKAKVTNEAIRRDAAAAHPASGPVAEK